MRKWASMKTWSFRTIMHFYKTMIYWQFKKKCHLSTIKDFFNKKLSNDRQFSGLLQNLRPTFCFAWPMHICFLHPWEVCMNRFCECWGRGTSRGIAKKYWLRLVDMPSFSQQLIWGKQIHSHYNFFWYTQGISETDDITLLACVNAFKL